MPESFIYYDHDYLLKKMVDEFKEKYGVECFAALHHNKRKTNLHIHMIFAERAVRAAGGKDCHPEYVL